jgi:hypothetical protein
MYKIYIIILKDSKPQEKLLKETTLIRNVHSPETFQLEENYLSNLI